MTFAAFDTSAHAGSVVWLYTFTQGVTVTRYTNVATDQVVDGHTYTAVAITHSEIDMNGELSADKLDVTLPRSEAFALQFVSDVMEQETTLLIRKGHATDPDGEFIDWWDGAVGGGEVKAAEVTLACVSIRSMMRQTGLRRRYQKPCPYVHYGRGCWLDRADFAVAGLLTEMVGVELVVPEAAGYPYNYFRGGQIAEPGGVLRWIIAHSGDLLILLRPFGPAVAAALAGAGTLAVTLYPGCDRTEGTCDTVFDNLDNCGCLTRMPARNPYNGSAVF